MFSPFRQIGICSQNTGTVQVLGDKAFVCLSIGTQFQVYSGDKLQLLLCSPSIPQINALLTFKELTFACCDDKIYLFSRLELLQTIDIPQVTQLVILGNLLLALGQDGLYVWDLDAKALINCLSVPGSCFLHPSTYVNKVLIASGSSMQLWNIHTMKLIYQFQQFHADITCLVQAPAIDVAAIGLLDGTIVLYNLRAAKEIVRFQQQSKVTGVSFRTDGTHTMVTAGMSGDLAIWDLSEKRLVHVLKAHDASIHTCYFYSGMPVLLTASSDNSIKQWIFDGLDGVPRLLKSRSGHHQPPTKIKYYGDDGRVIISAGQCQSLRYFSVMRDEQNVEISQGSLAKKSKQFNVHIDQLKLPNILDFDANPLKQKDWDNLVTCHAGETFAKTWSMQRKAIGKHALESKDGGIVKAVAVSSCGNFALIASSKGGIDKYNIQSGLHRCLFAGHAKAVTGLIADNINNVVVSSSLDKTIKFWDFKTGQVQHEIVLDTVPSEMQYSPDTGLLAVACDDMLIRVFDVRTRAVVRLFKGHNNRITGITFSPDSRWLCSCGLDATIRTWDLPTGNMIDAFLVDDLPTSIAFSPKSDFLASTHVGKIGIFLWANRSQYENIPIRRLAADEIRQVAMPVAGGNQANADESDSDSDSESDAGSDAETPDIDLVWKTPIPEDEIVLSDLPKSRWQNLLSLDAIKKRNKPIEPPKAPEKAPFFLSATSAVVPQFVKDDKPVEEGTIKYNASHHTQLVRKLEEGYADGDCTLIDVDGLFFDYLKELGPSAIDAELRLIPEEEDLLYLKLFLEAMIEGIESKKDFELYQAYLLAFLKVNGLT